MIFLNDLGHDGEQETRGFVMGANIWRLPISLIDWPEADWLRADASGVIAGTSNRADCQRGFWV